jgi:O-antigen ligase
MSALRLRLGALAGRDELSIALAAAAATAVLAFAGVQKLGVAGLLAPLAVGLLIVLLYRPLAMTIFLVGLVMLCEGPTFGLFSFTSSLYSHVTVLNVLVALVVVSVGLDLMRRRQAAHVPSALRLALVILALGMVAGAATGHAAGVSFSKAAHLENVLAYLLLLPIAVANLDIDSRQVSLLLRGALVLAVIKATLGLIEIGGGYGAPIEGAARLTYYEPTANWLTMIALFGVCAALLARTRVPLWVALTSPLLVGCLALSYRRSFWIGAVLGLLLVLLLSLSPMGRRMLVPVGLLIAAAILLLGSVNFQSQTPIVRRIASLAPNKLDTNVQDSYRLGERANVLGAIRANPITGLGINVPWSASVRPLSVEHPGGRLYVHFDALWLWLKLGILGLLAYVSLLVGATVLAWRVWRYSREPLLRAFGLASLCGFAGLVAIETTASFTGVDPRFTVLLGTQIGLLALLARTAT